MTWDFGDGSPAAGGIMPEHVFRDDGVYTAKVTVKDDAATVTDEARVTVRNVAPSPMLDARARRSRQARRHARRRPRPGRGRPAHVLVDLRRRRAARPAPRVTHAYAAAGTYTVKLRVDDGDGGSATDEATVVVGGPRGGRDTRGTDFWLSFPTNYSGRRS